MKKSKALKNLKNQMAVSWQPSEIGDSIQGKFAGFSPVGNGMYLNLEKCKPISVTTSLRQIFSVPENMKAMKGKIVKLVFVGTTKGQKGNPTKLFEVFAGGKKLEGKMFRAATEEEISEFFSEK